MSKHQQYIEKYGHQSVQAVNEKGTNTPNPSSNKKVTYLSPSGYGTSEKQRHQNPAITKAIASDITQPAVNSYMRKGSPREKLIQDLNHTDLSAILNTDTVDRRNRMLAEVGVPPFKHSKHSTVTNMLSKTLFTTKFVPTNERGSLVLNVLFTVLFFPHCYLFCFLICVCCIGLRPFLVLYFTTALLFL